MACMLRASAQLLLALVAAGKGAVNHNCAERCYLPDGSKPPRPTPAPPVANGACRHAGSGSPCYYHSCWQTNGSGFYYCEARQPPVVHNCTDPKCYVNESGCSPAARNCRPAPCYWSHAAAEVATNDSCTGHICVRAEGSECEGDHPASGLSGWCFWKAGTPAMKARRGCLRPTGPSTAS